MKFLIFFVWLVCTISSLHYTLFAYRTAREAHPKFPLPQKEGKWEGKFTTGCHGCRASYTPRPWVKPFSLDDESFTSRIDMDHGFRLDGCSFDYAHTWSKSGFSFCWRHLVTSKESSNRVFLPEKTHFPSCVRNVKWATI